MTLDDIYPLIKDDMKQVNACILERLQSDIVLINQIGTHIINSGGKRLRPVIHLLCARACGYEGSHHVELAAIIEFIHTATLLHDDVVDASELRRGQETANSLWGNEASVLVGDFLYSRAFQMMVDVNDMQIMAILANATNTIAEGEVQQLLNVHDPDTTEQRYLDVIHNKTAKLFESASELAAVITNQPDDMQQSMARYGMHLGTAFQLVDDILDYDADQADIGKNVGDDLAEGKPTLPLIYTMRNGNAEQTKLVREVIENGGIEQIDNVITAIRDTGAIEYTAKCAQDETTQAIAAIDHLPDSIYKTALINLARIAVARRS